MLHRQLSTILSVVSLTRKVDLVKFKELCDTTSFHLCDNFTWVKLNHTLHGTLHHSVELINLNDGYAFEISLKSVWKPIIKILEIIYNFCLEKLLLVSLQM